MALGGVAIVLIAGSASAEDEKTECIGASERAQRLRDEQKLLAARREIMTCSRDSCPAPVKHDCAELLADVVRRTPTIVVRAKGPKGEDVVDATLTIDRERVATQLTGEPVALDPGPHDFRIDVQGASLTKRIVVVQGEHERLLALDLEQPRGASSGSGQRVAGVVIGAVGLVGGLALGIPFGLAAIDQKNAQIAACSNASCPDAAGAARAHDAAITDGAISTVAFIAGGVLLATGIVVFAIAPHASRREAVSFTFGPGSASFGATF